MKKSMHNRGNSSDGEDATLRDGEDAISDQDSQPTPAGVTRFISVAGIRTHND